MSWDVDDELGRRVKQYYEERVLPPEVMKRMRLMAFTAAPGRKPRRVFAGLVGRPVAGFTAVALVVLFCVLAGWQYVGSRLRTAQQMELMAAEIALNHQKQFELDFQTPDVALLDDSMSDLDFSLIYPEELAGDDYTVLGARYCTIQSVIAAQIRLEDDGQREYTLYQFRAPDSAWQKPTTIVVDEIAVTFWQEEALLLGLAQAVR